MSTGCRSNRTCHAATGLGVHAVVYSVPQAAGQVEHIEGKIASAFASVVVVAVAVAVGTVDTDISALGLLVLASRVQGRRRHLWCDSSDSLTFGCGCS